MIDIVMPQTAHSWSAWFVLILSLVGALAGILGTYFMARRYASTFLSGLMFAVGAIFLRAIGEKDKVRQFYAARLQAQSDFANTAADMSLGLMLLFWAFFLQLASTLVSFWSGP
jgi:H+/Cl- antiporter ClcA